MSLVGFFSHGRLAFRTSRWSVRAVVERELHQLAEVKRASPRRLSDVSATAEAVGDEQCIGTHVTHGGKEHALAASVCDALFGVVSFETERAGHPTTSGREELRIELPR